MGHILISMKEGRFLLREWIDRAGLQDQEAAKLLKIDRSFLSQILHGKRRPTLPNACHFEDTTGVPVRAWVPLTSGYMARNALQKGARQRVA
jgi:plasmid maintenance system antidote protein VapI